MTQYWNRLRASSTFSPDWWVGGLAALSLTLCLVVWTFLRLTPQDFPLVLQPHVGPIMVIFSTVFAFFLISLSALIGSALRTPRIAIWALLLAAFCLEANAVASIGAALFGTAPLSNWSQLVLASCGALSVFVFGLTLWNLWVQVQEGHLNHAEHDVLTGLLNRRGFMRRFGLSSRHTGTLAVVDVNRLKLINDQFGHTAGDQQIQQVSVALESVSQAPSLLARWGGDEFVVFLESDLAHSTQVLKTLQQQHPSLLPGQPAFDFGLATMRSEESFDKGFALADHQLYLAKGDGAASSAALGEDQGLYEFGQFLAKLDSPEAVLRKGLNLIRTYLGFDLVTYAEIEGEQGDVLRSEGDGTHGVADRVAQELSGTIAPLPPFSRQVVRERRTKISVDYPSELEADPRFVELGLKTVIISPVFHGEEVVGLLALMHLSNWKALPLNAVRITELATTRLSHALEMHTAIANIRRTLEGSLLALGVALEARDLETHGPQYPTLFRRT